MARALLSPVIDACIAIAEDTGIDVGDAVAPDCPKPFIVVSAVSSPRYTGPLSDGEADSHDRIQFSFIGNTREQADWARDKLRAALTISALDIEFITATANRRTMRVILDIPRGVQRDDRGLPEPIFTGIDQYMIETTPALGLGGFDAGFDAEGFS
jgi:hypothetical protein